jgi:hypothetical protein
MREHPRRTPGGPDSFSAASIKTDPPAVKSALTIGEATEKHVSAMCCLIARRQIG